MAKEEGQKKITASNYFTSDDKDVDFFSTGCTLLDCAMGGGWPEGRVSNIYGNRSASKTGHAVEAVTNYVRKYADADVWYIETECAFDKGYAAAMGMPLDRVTFADDDDLGIEDCCLSIEGLFEYLELVVERQTKSGRKALIVVDSLDALSDRDELAGAIDQATYGANKAKRVSQMFRRLISRVHKASITMLFVSQVRDNIGGMGEKTTVSGGRALAFYCSIIVQVAAVGMLKRTSKGVERVIGASIRAKIKKNKVGLPFREADYPLQFGYGFDNITACIAWMQKTSTLIPFEEIGCTDSKIGVTNFCRKMLSSDREEYVRVDAILSGIVTKSWQEIETGFLPTRGKYG